MHIRYGAVNTFFSPQRTKPPEGGSVSRVSRPRQGSCFAAAFKAAAQPTRLRDCLEYESACTSAHLSLTVTMAVMRSVVTALTGCQWRHYSTPTNNNGQLSRLAVEVRIRLRAAPGRRTEEQADHCIIPYLCIKWLTYAIEGV